MLPHGLATNGKQGWTSGRMNGDTCTVLTDVSSV